MTLAKRPRTELIVAGVILLGCPAAAAALNFGPSKLLLIAGIGLIALVVGIYVGLRHPLWLFWGFAVALGCLPFGYLPGVHVPVYLPFLAGALLAAVLHPRAQTSVHPIEVVVWVMVAASAVSVFVTASSLTDWTVLIRWTMSTLILVALARLSQVDLARFGRIFVYAAALNSLFGMAIVAADPNHRFMKVLSIFDYDRVNTARYVVGDEGRSRIPRLGGTWVDPNGAGLAIGLALVLCIVLFAGRARAVIAAILVVALLLTLSRAAIFSVLVGILCVLLLHTMRKRNRQLIIGSIGLVAAIAVVTPSIRTRILSSFGSQDFGAADRGKALAAWPGYMSGHWFFGLGWGRREFTDGDYSFKFNIVANAPLIAAYRAGMIVGIIFVILLIVGCVTSYRLLRSDSLSAATFGGVFIGYCLVALQLDHPIVHIPQLVMTFAVFLAFLVYLDRERRSRASPPTVAAGPADRPSSSGAVGRRDVVSTS